MFQLSAALGCVPTEEVAAAVKSLDRASRRALARLGVRFGTETIYIEPLLGPDPVRFRALLWAVWHGRTPPKLPGGRRPGNAIAIDPDLPLSFYAAIGRRVVAGLALRPDRLERLAAAARSSLADWAFCRRCGIGRIGRRRPDALRRVLLALGYRAVIEGDREFFVAKPRRRAPDEQSADAPPPPATTIRLPNSRS